MAKKPKPQVAESEKRKKKKKPKPESGMPVPNHRAPVWLWPEDYNANTFSGSEPRCSLMRLHLPEEKGSGASKTILFVDEMYNLKHWAARENCPPTWMDPEVFVRQIMDSPEMVETIKKAAGKTAANRNSEVVAKCWEALESFYLPYLEQKLSEALPVLADWLIHYVTEKEAANDRPRKTKVKIKVKRRKAEEKENHRR